MLSILRGFQSTILATAPFRKLRKSSALERDAAADILLRIVPNSKYVHQIKISRIFDVKCKSPF